jgi:hypothetical protein
MINVPDKDAGARHRLLTRLVRLRDHHSANAICHLADSICYFGAVRQSLRRNPQGTASGEFLQKYTLNMTSRFANLHMAGSMKYC